MGEEFNPYSEWLDIPPESVPPNHYQLLGIELFESDVDTISHATKQRMARIKAHLKGEHATESKKLLGEIAAARVILFNAEKRARYDARLRRNQAGASSSSKISSSKSTRVRVVDEEPGAGKAGFPQISTAAATPTSSGDRQPIVEEKSKSISTMMLSLTIGIGAIGALAVLLIVYQLANRDSTEIANVTDPQDITSLEEEVTPPVAKESDTTNPDTTNEDPVKPADDKKAGVVTMIEEEPDEESLSVGVVELQESVPSKEATAEPSPKKPPRKPPQKTPKKPPKKPDPPPKKEPDEKAGFFAESSKKKAAIPDSESQVAAEKKINDIFSLASLKTQQEKAKAATALFQAAEETRDDLPTRFVLLKLATQLAAEGGDLKRSLEVIDTIGQSFEADSLAMKAYTLALASKKAGTGKEALNFNTQLVTFTMPLADKAMQKDDYKMASRLIEEVALPAVRRTRDKLLLQEVSQRRTELRERKEKYVEVGRALETLKETPDDPAANLVIGRWHTLEQGDWEKGMLYLAKGSDPAFARLAQLESSQPSDAEKQFELGDAWWELADDESRKFSEVVVDRFHHRGAYWYRRALPKLSGIRKVKAEQHLQATGISKEGNYALRFNGNSSFVAVNFSYDGSAPITIEAIARPDYSYSSGSLFGNYNYNYGSNDAGGLDLYCSSGTWSFRFYEKYIFTTTYDTYERKDYITLRSPTSSRPGGAFIGRGRQKSEPWVHVAGVYDGTQIRLYVDGVEKAVQALRGRHAPQNVLPFIVAAAPEGLAPAPTGVITGNHFRGDVKAVRISSVPRYTTKFKPPDQLAREDVATELLLIFNKGEGNTVEDSSGKKALIRDSSGRKKKVSVTGAIRGATWIDLDANSK